MSQSKRIPALRRAKAITHLQPRATADTRQNSRATMTEPQCKRSKMTSSLDQLKSMTTVVADTGDFEGKSAAALQSRDCFFPARRRNRGVGLEGENGARPSRIEARAANSDAFRSKAPRTRGVYRTQRSIVTTRPLSCFGRLMADRPRLFYKHRPNRPGAAARYAECL